MQICKYVSMQICENPINSCVRVGPCLARNGSDQFLPRYRSHPRGSHGEHFCPHSLDHLAFQTSGNVGGSNLKRIGKVEKN